MRIGVISDTHGVLPTSVHEAFAGVERIIHAGDIGSQAVLDELEVIAPVFAVEGNCDGGWQQRPLPGRLSVTHGGVRFLIGHQLPALMRAGIPEGTDVIIYGHTHVADARVSGGDWYVNPGSAVEPRDGKPPSVAIIEISGDRREVRHIFL
jgi:putative phosphoesterase